MMLNFFQQLTRRSRSAYLLTILLISIAKICVAQTNWSPTSGPPYLWSNPANWSNGVPTAGMIAIFDNGSTTCTLNLVPPVLGGIQFTGFAGMLDLNGNSLSVASTVLNELTTGSITSSSASTLSITSTNGITISGTNFVLNANAQFVGSKVKISVSTFEGTVNVNAGEVKLDGATFKRAVTITQTGTATVSGNGGNTFASTLTLVNNAAGVLILGANTIDIFNSTVSIINNSTGKIGIDRGNFSSNLSVFQGGGGAIYLGSSSGGVTLQPSVLISTAGAFSNGSLHLTNFVQLGFSKPEVLTLSNTATTIGALYLEQGTIFNADVTLSGPKIFFNGAIFMRTLNVTQNNTMNTSPIASYRSRGGNAFVGATTIRNTGFGRIAFDGNDAFSSTLTLINSSGDDGTNNARIIFGLDSAGTGAKVDIFEGNVSIQNSSDNTVDVAYGSSSQFNGNITTTCTGSCQNVSFGTSTGRATLADGRTITAVAGSFARGQLSLKGFTQVGTTAQNITLSGTASLRLSENSAATPTPTTFNAFVTLAAPALNIGKSIFNGNALIQKLGATTDSWDGGNTFNGSTRINAWTGETRFPCTSADTFIGPLTLSLDGGTLRPCYSANCNIQGDLTIAATITGNVVTGDGGGTAVFSGAASQIIDTGTNSLTFANLNINKASGSAVTLNSDIGVLTSATFTSGIMVSTVSNVVTFLDNASAIASNLSYVDGPVRKTGSGSFTFPTGDAGFLRTIGISDPGTTADITAEYMKSSAPNDTALPPTLEKVSDCEHWQLSGNVTDPVAVTLSWVNGDCSLWNYINDESKIRVAHYNGGAWVDLGNSSAVSEIGSGTVTSITTVATFSPFALSTTDASINALPIQLKDFTGERNDEGYVSLRWVTASEINNEGFDVERSRSGKDFTKVGEVAGNGTTRTEVIYQWNDDAPFFGRSYYRLRQKDFDGQTSYSKMITILNEDRNTKLAVFPNPATDVLFLSRAEDVMIFDSNGNILKEEWNAKQIDLKGLHGGIYYIKTSTGARLRFAVK
jgi:hypothetical protein